MYVATIGTRVFMRMLYIGTFDTVTV
jgi:hypothetical protein